MTLKPLKQQFESIPGLSVFEEETGPAAFLYIKTPNRAVEVSFDSPGFCVEYWDHADETSDVGSVRTKNVVSESLVLEKVRDWLIP